jgi:Uma2 family endonuclease
MSDAPSCSIAPEICIEVVSEANSSMELAHKRALYFQSGAIEVWQCDEKGGLTFFTPQGEVGSSSICPNFPKSVA